MAKKAKGNRVQVILECTEHKDSGMPGTSRYITTKEQKEYNREIGIEEIQPDSEESNSTQRNQIIIV